MCTGIGNSDVSLLTFRLPWPHEWVNEWVTKLRIIWVSDSMCVCARVTEIVRKLLCYCMSEWVAKWVSWSHTTLITRTVIHPLTCSCLLRRILVRYLGVTNLCHSPTHLFTEHPLRLDAHMVRIGEMCTGDRTCQARNVGGEKFQSINRCVPFTQQLLKMRRKMVTTRIPLN